MEHEQLRNQYLEIKEKTIIHSLDFEEMTNNVFCFRT